MYSPALTCTNNLNPNLAWNNSVACTCYCPLGMYFPSFFWVGITQVNVLHLILLHHFPPPFWGLGFLLLGDYVWDQQLLALRVPFKEKVSHPPTPRGGARVKALRSHVLRQWWGCRSCPLLIRTRAPDQLMKRRKREYYQDRLSLPEFSLSLMRI